MSISIREGRKLHLLNSRDDSHTYASHQLTSDVLCEHFIIGVRSRTTNLQKISILIQNGCYNKYVASWCQSANYIVAAYRLFTISYLLTDTR